MTSVGQYRDGLVRLFLLGLSTIVLSGAGDGSGNGPGSSAGNAPVWSSLFDAGRDAYDNGDDTKAEQFFQKACDLLKAKGNSLDLAKCYYWLAATYDDQERDDKAETLYKQALDIDEKLAASDSIEAARVLHALGSLYLDHDRFAESEQLLFRALKIREKVYGADAPGISTELWSLARAFYKQGKYEQAEPLFKRAIAIQEKGSDHLILATYQESLGRLYYRQGRFAEAEAFYIRALSTRKQEGTHDADLAFSLNYLADLYADERRYAEAEGLYREALSIAEKTLNPSDVQLSTYLMNVAGIYCAQSPPRLTEAERLLKRAIDIAERGAPDTEYLLGPLGQLAELYRTQRRFDLARPLYDRALNIQTKRLGPESAGAALLLHNSGLLSLERKDFVDAKQKFNEALRIMRKHSEIPGISTVLNNLAALYQEQQQFVEAEPLLKEAERIDVRFAGERRYAGRIQAMAERRQLILLKHCRDRVAQAIISAPALKAALAPLPEVPGVSAPAAAWQESADFYRSAVKTVSEIFGANSPASADCLEIASISSRMARSDAPILPDLFKILEIKEQALSSDELSTVETRMDVALYLQSIGATVSTFLDRSSRDLIKLSKALLQEGSATKRNDEMLSANSEDLLTLAYLLAGRNRDYEAKVSADISVVVAGSLSKERDAERSDLMLSAGELYQLIGQYGRARAALNLALQAASAANAQGRLFTVRLALARLALEQSDFDTAADCGERALATSQQLGKVEPLALSQCRQMLGQSAAGRGNLAGAIDNFKKALEAVSEVRDSSIARAAILNQLGGALADTNQWSECERYLNEALALSPQLQSKEGRLQTAETYIAIGTLYLRQQRLEDAAKQYARALDLLRKDPSKDLVVPTIRALNGYAAAMSAQGKYDLAREKVFAGAELMQQYIDTVFPQLSFAEQCAFLNLANEERTTLFSVCRSPSQSSATNPKANADHPNFSDVDMFLQEAHMYTARWKGLLIESLRRQSALNQTLATNQAVKPLVDEWQSKRRKLAGMTQKLVSDQAKALYKQVERELEEAEQRLASAGNLDLDDPLDNMGANGLRSRLKPDEAFVDIVTYRAPSERNNQVAAIAVSATDFRFVDLCEEHDLAILVERWRQIVTGDSFLASLTTESDTDRLGSNRGQRDVVVEREEQDQSFTSTSYEQVTAELRSKVWSKIVAAVPSAVNKFYLCLEGPIARVPWGAIAGDGTLMAEFDSPREFVMLAGRVSGPPALTPAISEQRKLLIAGNVDFNDPQRRVANLPATQREVEEIGKLAGEHGLAVQTLTREQATKDEVTKDMLGASYIHLATHGFAHSVSAGNDTVTTASRSVRLPAASGGSSYVVARNPLMDTGLFLAFPKGADTLTLVDEEPGILTAAEIVGLDLKACDLLSLSACQTGLGKGLSGQGVIGLRSAIMAAGARSILMSLWSVDDAATEALMREFYRNLWERGMSKWEALRRAQESIRTDRNHPEWAQPRYWAPWTIAGRAW